MWQILKCTFGLHSWRIAAEVDVPGTGFTEDPGDFECGGTDYVIRCAHCPVAYVDSRRGAWVPPKFPAYGAR